MGERVNGNSGAVHSLPASPRSGVVERNRQNKKISAGGYRCKWVARLVMMGWLVGAKGGANGDRPCKPEPTAPGGDVAVDAMTEPALSRLEPSRADWKRRTRAPGQALVR